MKNYWTIRIRKPTIKNLILLGQVLFALLVISCIVMALGLAFCMLFEILFGIKLLHVQGSL